MQDNQQNRLNILVRLKHALQALALPAHIQLGLLPDFVCKADELALDFDHWCSTVLQSEQGSLTEVQWSQLVAVDTALTEMNSGDQPFVWTDDAVIRRPEWQHVRVLAQAALDAFIWSLETPPTYRYEYVNSDEPHHDKS